MINSEKISKIRGLHSQSVNNLNVLKQQYNALLDALGNVKNQIGVETILNDMKRFIKEMEDNITIEIEYSAIDESNSTKMISAMQLYIKASQECITQNTSLISRLKG